jgi:hypothetical protein
MGKWLKKVDETPLVQNARVIDSLSGNSTINAPSIHTVNYWLNNPIGNLINEGYSSEHTVAQVLKVLETAEQSRYEDLSGAVVINSTYIDSCSLVRYGRVFELRATIKNVPSGTQLTDILTIPSNYVRGGMISVNMTAWGLGTPSYRNAIIKADGKLELKANFPTEETMQFKISATWIY